MKKLYLIGDSIRMGYAPFVAAALQGKVKVFWPDENCRFAAYTFYALGDWEADMRVGADLDLIHWNVGLHDSIHFGDEDAMTPPDVYGYYLGRIIHRLKFLYPAARQIFATSTPVVEERHSFWLSRKNAEIEELNRVALDVMQKNGIEVNDLHAIMSAAPFACHSDHAHFNNALGREYTTKAVLRAVCPPLGIDPDTLTLPDFTDDALAAIDMKKLMQ